jgi:NitT/TauT family transport system substrate-binding protein
MITRRSLMLSATAAVLAPAMPQPARAAEKWRHAIVSSKGDAAFFYMARAKGFFAKRGLEVELLELKGSKDVIRAVLSGDAESSDSIPADVLPALEKGADLKFIGSTILGYPYAMYVRKEITEWKQLDGKMFGVSGPGSAPHIFALAMLQTAGVPTANIQIANSGGTTSRIKALVAGKLDATAASTEFVPLADQMGLRVLGQAKDMAPMFPRFYVTTSGKVLKAREDAAVRFLAAYMEGLRYCVDHRDEAIKLSASINHESADDARYAYSYDEIVKGNLLSLNMELPRDRIAWMQDMMIKVGELKTSVPFDGALMPSVREKALALVGTR